MAATLEITCPNCGKDFKVPAEFAGKTIRCKNCQTAFPVPGSKAAPTARPATAKPAAPVAKPVARPAAAKPAAPTAADAPIPFKDDDEVKKKSPDEDLESDAVPFGIITEGEVPRCPFCAVELDPPDTKVCLNCGYDLLQRRRHEQVTTYEPTGGEYFMHLLPGIANALLVLLLLVLSLVCWLNMSSWLEGSFLESDDKNEITGQKVYYIKPWCFSLWFTIISLFVCYRAGKFAIKRLIINPKPAEHVKRT